MIFGALEFPPIDDIVKWPDGFLKDSAFGFNKVALIYVLALVIPAVFFALADVLEERLAPADVGGEPDGIELAQDDVALTVQGQLVPGRREELPDTRQQAGERSKFDHGTPLGVGHARGGFGGHISRA